jgi:hypothetical protein
MSESAESFVGQQLSAGERLLWTGQPPQGVMLRGSDVFLIPFSMLWAGFAFFWEFQVVRANAPFFFKLWGIPFVLFGLYFVFGRFFTDARVRTRTFYAVTSERVIIIAGLFSRQIKSLNLRTLADLTVTEHSNGSGTISFGTAHPLGSFFPASSWPGSRRYMPPSFELSDRVRDVYEIIRKAQRESSTPG